METNPKKLIDICGEFVDVEEGLMEGTISFEFDRLRSAMGASHPAEVLNSILEEVYMEAVIGKEPPLKKVEKMMRDLKSFKEAFDVAEIEEPLKDLAEYLKARKTGL